MLSLSLFALTGCDGLFTAPNPTTGGTGSQQQETQDVTDDTQPTTTYMYVINGVGKTIDEINLKTMAVTSNIMGTGLFPNQATTKGVVSWLVNSGDNNLVKLDLRARKTLATLNLANGSNPSTLSMIAEDKGMVTNNMTGDLAFVDLHTMTAESTLALPKGVPFFEPAIVDGKAYVGAVEANYDNYPAITYTYSAVYVVNLATKAIAKTIELDADANPGNASVDPSGKVWIAVKDGLVKIDPATDTVTKSLVFGEPVTWVRYLSATKAYGSIYGGLISFDPTTDAVLKTSANKIPVASDWGAFKIFKGVGYVSSQASNSVTVVDFATEAASGSPIPVGDGPQDLTFVTVED
jgi:YVTN family beta-propeller protein